MSPPPISTSIKSLIMQGLKDRIDLMGYFQSVEFKKIRMLSSDFQPNELPALQLISIGEEIFHERPRIKRNWIIHLEIVMKSDELGVVDQTILWDAQLALERQLGAKMQMGIVGMVDITMRGTIDDLHMQEPYYTMRIEIACKFFTDYGGLP